MELLLLCITIDQILKQDTKQEFKDSEFQSLLTQGKGGEQSKGYPSSQEPITRWKTRLQEKKLEGLP